MNARGFEQVDGVHFDENTKAAPVVNMVTIHLVFILIIMAAMYSELVDVKGAFLCGEFADGEVLYMKVPQLTLIQI